MEEQIVDNAIDILLPVMESAIVVAGEYTKNCGRTVLTAGDMRYAMRYCAKNVTGKHLGTLFPELGYDTDDSDDEEAVETVDESEEEFTRYSGDDPTMNDINEAHDTWDQWEPQTPMEIMLKEAIDKNMY